MGIWEWYGFLAYGFRGWKGISPLGGLWEKSLSFTPENSQWLSAHRWSVEDPENWKKQKAQNVVDSSSGTQGNSHILWNQGLKIDNSLGSLASNHVFEVSHCFCGRASSLAPHSTVTRKKLPKSPKTTWGWKPCLCLRAWYHAVAFRMAKAFSRQSPLNPKTHNIIQYWHDVIGFDKRTNVQHSYVKKPTGRGTNKKVILFPADLPWHPFQIREITEFELRLEGQPHQSLEGIPPLF